MLFFLKQLHLTKSKSNQIKLVNCTLCLANSYSEFLARSYCHTSPYGPLMVFTEIVLRQLNKQKDIFTIWKKIVSELFIQTTLILSLKIVPIILQCTVQCTTYSAECNLVQLPWRGESRCLLQWPTDARPCQTSPLTSVIVHLHLTNWILSFIIRL